MNKKKIIFLVIIVVFLLIGVLGIVLSGNKNKKTSNGTESELTEETSSIVDVNTETESEADTIIESESTTTESNSVIESETTSELETVIESETEIESELETEVSSTEIENETSGEIVYTYKDLNSTMWAKSSVNVRDLPNSDGNKLGRLSTNDEVTVTGKCNETGWYRITYNGKVGYVSSSYLTSEEPRVEEPVTPVKPSKPAETEKEDTTNKPASSESDEVTSGDDGLSQGAQSAIEVGYYKVVADPKGGYCLIVKDASEEEKEKGYQLLEEFLDELGYKPVGKGGCWISSGNNMYYKIFCRDVEEKTAMDESFEDIFGW